MIAVVYDRASLALRAEGHAGAGALGSDIVCAAASMLLYTLAANAFELGAAEVSMESGRALVRAAPSDGQRERAQAAFDGVCKGFALLAGEYPGNVRYEERG